MASKGKKKATSQWDPNNQEAVGFFKHFTKGLMQPYGKALGVLPDHEILRKLYSYTCEWLNRPYYAMSEMADSLYSNLSTVEFYQDKIFSKPCVRYITSILEPLKPVLRRFNNKDKDVNDAPDWEDLALLMRTMESDSTFQEIIKEQLAASGAMFLITNQIMVLQTLLWNPQEFASRAKETKAIQKFKKSPTRENMRDYLINEILIHPSSSQQSREADEPSIWNKEALQKRNPHSPTTAKRSRKENVWGTKRQERKKTAFRTEQDEEDEDDTSKDEHEEYDEEEHEDKDEEQSSEMSDDDEQNRSIYEKRKKTTGQQRTPSNPFDAMFEHVQSLDNEKTTDQQTTRKQPTKRKQPMTSSERPTAKKQKTTTKVAAPKRGTKGKPATKKQAPKKNETKTAKKKDTTAQPENLHFYFDD